MHYAVLPALVPKIKEEYIQGRGSVREIAERYGQPYKTLEVRCYKEGWVKKREAYLGSLMEKSREVQENRAKLWEEKVFNASASEFDMVTKSILSAYQSSGDQGIEPDMIAGYARAKKLLDDMARRSLGLVDPAVKLDLTTGGKSLGESFVDALAKLRASPLPAPTSEEVDRILECEIVEESNEGV